MRALRRSVLCSASTQCVEAQCWCWCWCCVCCVLCAEGGNERRAASRARGDERRAARGTCHENWGTRTMAAVDEDANGMAVSSMLLRFEGALRELCVGWDPADTCQRFLKARDGDLEAANAMLEVRPALASWIPVEHEDPRHHRAPG